jgi:hypothetical protein
MSEEVFRNPFTLFPVRYTYRYSRFGHLQDQGDFVFIASNPPYGAIINYFLPQELGEDEVSIKVTDASGGFVHEMNGTTRQGLNRVLWNFRQTVEGAQQAQQPTSGRGRGFSPSVEAVPGTYTITVSAAGATQSQTVDVRLDPRLEGKVSLQDMIAMRDVQIRILELVAELDGPAARLQGVSSQVQQLRQFLGTKTDVPQAARDALNDFSGEIRELTTRYFAAGGFRAGPGGSVRARLTNINRELSGITGPVPGGITERIDALVSEVRAAAGAVEQFLNTRVPEFNTAMSIAGIPFIQPPEIPPAP